MAVTYIFIYIYILYISIYVDANVSIRCTIDQKQAILHSELSHSFIFNLHGCESVRVSVWACKCMYVCIHNCFIVCLRWKRSFHRSAQMNFFSICFGFPLFIYLFICWFVDLFTYSCMSMVVVVFFFYLYYTICLEHRKLL